MNEIFTGFIVSYPNNALSPERASRYLGCHHPELWRRLPPSTRHELVGSRAVCLSFSLGRCERLAQGGALLYGGSFSLLILQRVFPDSGSLCRW